MVDGHVGARDVRSVAGGTETLVVLESSITTIAPITAATARPVTATTRDTRRRRRRVRGTTCHAFAWQFRARRRICPLEQHRQAQVIHDQVLPSTSR